MIKKMRGWSFIIIGLATIAHTMELAPGKRPASGALAEEEGPQKKLKAESEQTIETIPQEMLEVILSKLLENAPGTTLESKLHNAADNIRNFLMTNKNFAELLEDEGFNRRIIDQLAARYTRNNNRINAAIALRTIGAAHWLFKNVPMTDLSSYFLHAVQTGNLPVIRFITSSSDPFGYSDLISVHDHDGKSLIMIAVENNDFDMVQELYNIYTGAEGIGMIQSAREFLFNQVDYKKNNILHFAVKLPDMRIFNALLKIGIPPAAINRINKEEVTPFLLALEWKNPEAATALINLGATLYANIAFLYLFSKLDPETFNPAIEAAMVQLIDLLLKHKANPNVVDLYFPRSTPLIKAVKVGSLNLVKKLLSVDLAESINLKDHDSKTALDYALTLSPIVKAPILRYLRLQGAKTAQELES